MADKVVNIVARVDKPEGVGEAAKGFDDLAKAADDAAKAVRSARSAGSAFADQIARENKEGRKTNRKQREAERVQAIDDAAEERRQRQKQEAKDAQARYSRRSGFISSTARGGVQGALGSIGGKAGVAGAVIEAVGLGMDRVAKSAEILNDSFATGAQTTRALFAEFVPLGDKLIRLGDALDGTTDAIRRQQEDRQLRRASDSLSFEYRGKMGAANLENIGYQAQYAATQRIGMAGYIGYDRSTLAGERAAQRQGATIGAQDEATAANRASMAAAAVKQAADAAVKQANERVKAQEERARAAQGALTANTNYENRGFRDKAGRDKAAGNVELERGRLAQELASREQVVAAAKEKGLAAIQAEAQARAASVNLAKAELAVLEQQEARMRGMAQSAGAMSQGEFTASANALKMYQDNGGNAPPEIEAMVARLAPDLVRKNQENRGGERYEQLKSLLGEDRFKSAFGDDFGAGNSLKEIMAKVDKVKADIRVDINLDTTTTAKQLADLLKPTLENLKVSFEMALKNKAAEIKAGNAVRNNAAN